MKVIAKNNVYEPLTDEKWQEILEKGRLALKDNPYPNRLEYLSDKRVYRIFFTDQRAVDLPVDFYEEFNSLSDDDLSQAFLSPAGTALCLDDYDLDVSVHGLINDNPDVSFFSIPNNIDRSTSNNHSANDAEKRRLQKRKKIIRAKTRLLNKKVHLKTGS